jgi:hypothetical protein
MNNKKKKRSAGLNTIIQYKDDVKRLVGLGIRVDGSMSLKTIITIFNKQQLKKSTQGRYIFSLKWHLMQNNISTKLYLDKLTEKGKRLADEIKAKKERGIMSNIQLMQYLPWIDILNTFNKISRKKDINQVYYDRYVTLAVYVLFPPRRLIAYSLMDIVQTMPDATDISRNYYIQSESSFIFNNYKTYSSYGQQKFKVGNKLKQILNDYILKFNILGSLFGITSRTLSERLRLIFAEFNKKKLSVDILRSSFIIYKYETNKLTNASKKYHLATKMAHSRLIQEDYYKKDLIATINSLNK